MEGHRCELRSGVGARAADRTDDDLGGAVGNMEEPSDKPATISFATALRRVRSLRQHAALLDHLYELVVTRFFAEGVGNESEYTVSLGREDVVVEGVIVEQVLLLLSDEMDRLRAEQRELEGAWSPSPVLRRRTKRRSSAAKPWPIATRSSPTPRSQGAERR